MQERSGLGAYFFAALAGYAYVALWPWHPYPGSFLLKATPMLVLAVLAALKLDGRDRVLAVVAFVMSAVGDALLDVDRANLLPGLLAFLVTQLCYVALFAPRAAWQPARVPVLVVLVLADAAFLVAGWPKFGPLLIPIVVYLTALLTMASAGVMVRGNRALTIGALLFLVSDTLIGVNAFIAPFAQSTPIIVGIYFTAQLFIGWGMLFHRREAFVPGVVAAHAAPTSAA
ncbi:MAG TPA: lysoplasmalogenase [Xanthomonadales bacterium]|nr:lysoplasmalogenase [Xanthomonadales bacterium]